VLALPIMLVQYNIPEILYYPSSILFKHKYKAKLKDRDKFKILMIWAHGLGEQELISRYKIITKKMGINYKAVSTVLHESKLDLYAAQYANKVGTSLPELAIAAMQPDLIITLQHKVKHYMGAPNYRILDKSLASFTTKSASGMVSFSDPDIYNFDGLLMPFSEVDQAKAIYESSGKKFYGMNWYPTSYVNDYKPSEPRYLFYIGGEYGIRNSTKYAQIIQGLDKHRYLDVAAAKLDWKDKLVNIRERIPFDGVSLIQQFNITGIALILHGEAHLYGATPTGRIFEAAAGNAVIISDKNGFVEKHFGNNVLYIDVEQDAGSVINQIDQHMQWIYSNTEQAKQMANRCHEIFLEKFTLELQLQRLIKMHKERMAEI